MRLKVLLAYFRLTKPRVIGLVVLSSVAGYLLGGRGDFSGAGLACLAAGAMLTCAGAAVLNQYLERNLDAKMSHTRNRPLPAGILPPAAALNFGIILTLAGTAELCLTTNLLTAFLSLLTSFIYIVIYTPMKRINWLSTSLGAIAGALPPVAGWAAATGGTGPGAWVLFLILYIWQHPHFYSIAWMYRRDYKAAGFKTLSVVDTGGHKVFRQIFFYSLLLIPAAFLPHFFGLPGGVYGTGSLILGAVPLALSAKLLFSKSDPDTRKLFQSSVAYLPALLLLVIFSAG